MESTRSENEQAWRYEAKCAMPESYPQVDVGHIHRPAGEIWTDLFFPPRDRALYKPIADAAKAMCYGKDGAPACPVRKMCLMDAIDRDEVHGILGGKSHRERGAIIRRHAAQHPEMELSEYVHSEFCR